MSWQATQWALKQVPPGLVSLPARAVLGVYADYAADDGKASFPSISTVAWHLGCTERNVAGHVKALIKAGLLRVSPNQSHTADLPADRRPVVYDLPVRWVRTDPKPEAKQRGRKAAAGVDNGVKDRASEPDNGVKDSSPITDIGMKDSVKRGEESFPNGVKDSDYRGEENFIQTTHEPPKEPPTNSLAHVSNASRSEPTPANDTEHHVQAICQRLHERILANGLAPDPPVIHRGWELAARQMIQVDRRDPTKVLNLIDWCQNDSHWRAVVLDMLDFRRNYKRIHAKAVADWQAKKTQANTMPLQDQRFYDIAERGARLAQAADHTPPPAITRGFFAPVRELQAAPTTGTQENPAA